jgi:hypothetical protein
MTPRPGAADGAAGAAGGGEGEGEGGGGAGGQGIGLLLPTPFGALECLRLVRRAALKKVSRKRSQERRGNADETRDQRIHSGSPSK